MKLSSLKQSKGFTLVEILIVVIIVGLLSGIAVSKLGDSKERAVASVKKSAAAELNKAIQATYVKGLIIATTPAAGSASDAAPIQALITALQAREVFTSTSAAEMLHGITDRTPNGGFLTTNAAAHRDLEVIYTGGPGQTYTGAEL